MKANTSMLILVNFPVRNETSFFDRGGVGGGYNMVSPKAILNTFLPNKD